MSSESSFPRQNFPTVVPRTRSEELGVAAMQTNSRRGFVANKKDSKSENTNMGTGAMARDLEVEADVLFQRIYDKWYAFSVVEDDCLVTQVSEEEVQKRLGKKTPRAA